MEIKVNYQNSIIIDNRIFVDPLKVDGEHKAEYVFITHPHWDHFSIEDIKKVLTSDTKIICPFSMKNEIQNVFENQIIYVEPEQNYEIDEISFETFRSYNIDKQFHPKENNWVGYNLNVSGERIAIVGDSDNTPELRVIMADVLLIPIGGKYTMNVQEAADATNAIKPKKVIPTHYGDIVGEKDAGEKFKLLINENIDCEILLK